MTHTGSNQALLPPLSSGRVRGSGRVVTLTLCTILHAFSHAMGALLVPLYLMMTSDLKLNGVKASALVVTVYGMVYNGFAWATGMLADRYNRKTMLGIGLIGNAAAIGMMGLVRNYEAVLLLAVVCGLFGSIFHPAANALVTAHYPEQPGMAIGWLGVGSGLGFFIGPQFAGWRATTATWTLWHVSAWQRPCVEMGLMGVVFGILFVVLAREAPELSPSPCTAEEGRGDRSSAKGRRAAVSLAKRATMDRALRRRVIWVSVVLGCRDFAAVAALSLVSIFMQKAWGRSVEQAGRIIGLMMLLGIIANPLMVYLTPGRRRLPGLTMILIAGGLIVATTPLWPAVWVLPVLCAFEAMQLGSYAVSDASMLERTAPELRGRVVGLFLLIAGVFSGTAPWIMGLWVDLMGRDASRPMAYVWPFGLVGAMMLIAAFSPRIIGRMGLVVGPKISAFSEIMPGTVEPGA
jgi:MFS family permease